MVLLCQQSEAHTAQVASVAIKYTLQSLWMLLSHGTPQDVGNSMHVHKDGPAVFLWEAVDIQASLWL